MFTIVIVGLALIGARVALPLVEFGLILELAVQMEYAHNNKGENAVEKPYFTSDKKLSVR